MVIKIPALICCALYNVRNVRWLSRFNTTHKFSSGFLVGSRIELLELAIDQKFGKCLNCVHNSFLIEYVSKRDPTSLPPSIFRRYKNGNIFLIIADELQTTAGSSPLNTIYTDNLLIEIFPFFFFLFSKFDFQLTRDTSKRQIFNKEILLLRAHNFDCTKPGPLFWSFPVTSSSSLGKRTRFKSTGWIMCLDLFYSSIDWTWHMHLFLAP